MTGPIFSADAFAGDNRARFGKATTLHRHRAHDLPLFTDDGLATLLARYPREAIGVFAMGATPGSWRRGRLGDIPAGELLDSVKAGRVWLNLRAASDRDAEIGALSRAILGEMRAALRGFVPVRPDLGLIISSPGAKVFYHLDVARVMLFHVRGHKRVWIYPRRAPYVTPRDLEGVVVRRTEEDLPYAPGFDAGAEIIDLAPGEMASWEQNAPHRVENGPDLNVSLSFEYMTPVALARANVIHANAWLRDRFGYNGSLEARPALAWPAKVALSRALKRVEPVDQARPASFPYSFTLNRGGMAFDSAEWAI